MKKMRQTELLQYVAGTVITYDKLEVTRNILWDYMCQSPKILDWLVDGCNSEPLYIAIRKNGTEIGSKDYVNEQCNVFGRVIHTIIVSKRTAFDEGYDFCVDEY